MVFIQLLLEFQYSNLQLIIDRLFLDFCYNGSMKKLFRKFSYRKEITMFDMKQIGKKITELRKHNNLTQMELADKLNISFQAVSNWERGNTMPDISKLPELAEIFKVSVDELLSGKASLIESVIEGALDSYIEEGNLTEEEVVASLPLLKPIQVEELLSKSDLSYFKNIDAFLPYMNEDDVYKLAVASLEKGDSVEGFLDYMDEGDIAKLATVVLEKGESVENFLPYMDEGDIAKLSTDVLEKGESMENFLPYMDEGDIAKLATAVLEKGESVENFLPYMDEGDIAKLATVVLEKGDSVEIFLPYMDEGDIAKLAMKLFRKK